MYLKSLTFLFSGNYLFMCFAYFHIMFLCVLIARSFLYIEEIIPLSVF